MLFDKVINATESDGGSDNPAALLAKHILANGESLDYVGIEVRVRGKGYVDYGQGFVVTHKGDFDATDKSSASRDLAEAIVEECAGGQSGYDKPVDWRVRGYNHPDKGDAKVLFEERFKVRGREREPTMKETSTGVISASNQILRQVAEDNHKNYMDISRLLLRVIEPVSTMAGNIAEKVRPSDAEMAHKTRMAEMELDAAVAQAEAVGKQARSQNVNETARQLFDQIPWSDLGEAAKHLAQTMSARERAKEREQANSSKTSPPDESETDVPTTETEPEVEVDTSKLCESSRTLAQIIAGRRGALESALGGDWAMLEPLAQQADQAAFDELAKSLFADFSARSMAEQLRLFTAMSEGLGDPKRVDRLQAFLKNAGILG